MQGTSSLKSTPPSMSPRRRRFEARLPPPPRQQRRLPPIATALLPWMTAWKHPCSNRASSPGRNMNELKAGKAATCRQHRLQHRHRQRHRPSWWPPSRHWRKPLRTAPSVPPSAASFPRYTSATPTWPWLASQPSSSARILRLLLLCRYRPNWIT